jgi:serine/threonine protein kinase
MPEKVFVSYSHKDDVWYQMFRRSLGSGVYGLAFQIWSDKDIGVGTNWRAEIDSAIASSRIALLLVSRNFLQSDFIANTELKAILSRHEAGEPDELSIWWVPLEKITEAERRLAKLDEMQAAWPLSNPLSGLDDQQRANAIAEILSRLTEEITKTSDDLRQKVAAALGSRTFLEREPLAVGDYSVFYKAKRFGVELAVKALVPLPSREWLGEDFVKRAQAVQNVANATAINIQTVITDPRMQCVVMEFVSAPTLKSKLENEGGLSRTLIADILAQLARVAIDLHRIDGQPIIGPVRPSHVHYDGATGKARISLVPISNETLKSCQQRPTRLLGPDALTYLSPERYDGRNIDVAADQYYLGLLGLELWQGKPPVEVATFADLEKKRRFFESPRGFFGGIPSEQPAFSFVLAKMLEREPQKRWTSMSDLARALEDVAEGVVPQIVKDHATRDYNDTLRKNDNFFRSFYDTLFASSDEIAKLFDRGKMPAQYEKLNKAMKLLFNFNPRTEPSSLEDQIESHGGFGLKVEHFDLFRDAFLQALRATQINDEYSHEAWRAVLGPALTYMRNQICREQAKGNDDPNRR